MAHSSFDHSSPSTLHDLPTPAIVAQSAVRRLPRLVLLLLCAAYVLAGFVGRGPWKNVDIASFGYMAALARGQADWLSPTLLGLPPEVDALLPYWLGAWAQWLAPGAITPDFAVRVPFALLLALTFTATWYGVYYLARTPLAQPVAFAFGGEARPADYARAIADGGLLGLIACLGLAQLSHETTPALAQLCGASLLFYGVAALPYRTVAPLVGAALGLLGLALSGAPAMAALFGLGSAAAALRSPTEDALQAGRLRRGALVLAGLTLLAAALAWGLDLWRWRLHTPDDLLEWTALGRLLLWFTWPVWPLALWTLWRWRHQLATGQPSLHLAVPLWFSGVAAATTVLTASSDRSLLLGLPALAALAAFALPTLSRSVSALIDWFTLLFFTGCAFIIWVVWIAMQTGVPQQPAANVSRLAPGFEPSFGFVAFVAALVATLSWAWLVRWRVGRHRAAIWKTLVLPAGGAALCWLLLMTLWLPLLDFARSYAPQVQRVVSIIGHPACVEAHGLTRAQVAAFQYHGRLALRTAGADAAAPSCPWLIVDSDGESSLAATVDLTQWQFRGRFRRPSDNNDDVLLFQRASTP